MKDVLDELLTSASEGLDILVHIVKVIVNLLHPVGLCPVGVEDELVLVIQISHVLVVALVEALPLLVDGILQAATVVPNLQFASRHDKECLNIIFLQLCLSSLPV